MRALVSLAAASLVAIIAASPVAARTVRMETVVALEDRSEPSIKQALQEAFETSLRGAVAMGFSRMRVSGARVLPDSVVLATIATDEDEADDDQDLDQGTLRESLRKTM